MAFHPKSDMAEPEARARNAGPKGLGQASEEPQGNEASPEEQAIYDQVVNNALEVIYPKDESDLAPAIREALSAGDDPIMNLAMAAVSVVMGLVQSAKAAGQKIPGEVLFNAGSEIIELLAEAAEAFKIYDYSEEDMERALYRALDIYREQATASGDLDPETLKQDFADLKAADDAGQLDQVLPGAVEYAKKFAPKEVEGEEQA